MTSVNACIIHEKGGLMGTKKRGEWRATQFLVDPEIHKQLRIAAIEEGISMAEALRQAVMLWLETTSEKRNDIQKKE